MQSIVHKIARGSEVAMNASEIIKKCRTENRLTKSGVAELVGVTTPTVSKWENGIGEPPFSTVMRLLEVLKYHVEIVDDHYEDRSKRT